jgi:hypothetical protein
MMNSDMNADPSTWLATIAMWIAFGVASAYFAKKQKRNPYIWFIVGLFLGIFGLLLLLMLPLVQRLRQKSPSPTQASPTTITIEAKPTSALQDPTKPEYENALWYYLDDKNMQTGPMSFQAFENDWGSGKIIESSYIWSDVITNWKTFKEVFPDIKNTKGL